MHDKPQLLENLKMDRPNDASVYIIKDKLQPSVMFRLKLVNKNNRPSFIISTWQIPETSTPKQIKHFKIDISAF